MIGIKAQRPAPVITAERGNAITESGSQDGVTGSTTLANRNLKPVGKENMAGISMKNLTAPKPRITSKQKKNLILRPTVTDNRK
jgi:hypothetical protein